MGIFSRRDKDGYDKDGYDKDGYDRDGWDKRGYNRDGDDHDRDGYDKYGYDRAGWDKNGYNYDGYTYAGWHKNGTHIATGTGFNGNGFDKEGWDKDGIDRDGYDKSGYDRNGYNKKGYNEKTGFWIDGYNNEGIDRDGIDRDGYDRNGYNRDGIDRDGIEQFNITPKFSKIISSFNTDFDVFVTLGYNKPTKIQLKSFFSHDKKTGIYSKTFESFSSYNVVHFHIEKAGKQYGTIWNKPKDTGRLQGDNFESGYTLIVTFNKNDNELKKILIDKLNMMNFGCLTSEYTLDCHLNEEYPNDERAKELLERVVKLFQSQNIESGV